MIDATKISNFNLTVPELEENILFWVTAAGKNGVTSAKLLNEFIKLVRFLLDDDEKRLSPFELIVQISNKKSLKDILKTCGIGNYTMKGKAFWQLAHSDLNLQTCTVDDLSKIHGIGPKTARAFLVHTRPNQRYAVIDTHLLKFLRDQGIIAPKSTPPEGPVYHRLEEAFLSICDKYALSPAELDLAIWNHYRKKELAFDLEAFANECYQSSICPGCDGRGN